MKNMANRQIGYYWVNTTGRDWEILRWEGDCWNGEEGLLDDSWHEINENRILSPEECARTSLLALTKDQRALSFEAGDFKDNKGPS